MDMPAAQRHFGVVILIQIGGERNRREGLIQTTRSAKGGGADTVPRTWHEGAGAVRAYNRPPWPERAIVVISAERSLCREVNN
jgi:hypothetical protein